MASTALLPAGGGAKVLLVHCQILRGVARVLELSAVATTSAFTFLHRVQQQHGHDCGLTSQELVCACIYLAAKVEEVHVSTNQLINTARVLADPTQQHLLEALAPLPLQGHLPAPQQQQQPLPNARPGSEPATAPQAAAAASEAAAGSSQQEQQQQHVQPHSAAIVVGEAYYAAKEQLFMAEQAVLRLMRFQLGVQQPHKYLLNFCQLLGLQQQLAAAAVCVLNDAIAYTTLVCEQESAVVAAAALQYVLQRPGGDAVVEWVVGQMSRDVQGCSREEGGRGGGSSRDWRHEPPRHSHRSPHDDSRGSGGSRKGAGTVREADPASGGVLAGGEWIPAVGLQVEQVSAAQAVIHELYTHCNGLQ